MATGRAVRQFEVSRRDAPYRQAIIVGITGASFSGKTYSALRMATGFKRVLGGSISVIDTEADRARHYEEYFEFDHVPFPAPHGPIDYKDAIDSCVSRGATIIVVDNMSHEHEGEGGVLDQIERFMEAKEAEYREKNWNFNRETFNFSAQIKPKRERRELNRRIVQLGKQVIFILCYQAQEKIRPRKKGETDDKGKPIREPEVLGWQPITTSTLPRDMTVRFLLTPACEGVPLLMPPNAEEQKLIKQPRQFKEWFQPGEPLSEAMGERLANWAIRKAAPAVRSTSSAATAAPAIADYEKCATREAFDALEQRRKAQWSRVPTADKPALKDASDKALARLTPPADRTPYTTASAIEALKSSTTEEQRAATMAAIVDDFDARNEELPLDVDDCNNVMREKLASGQLF